MKCAIIRRLNLAPMLLLLFGCVSQEAQLNDISLTPMNFEVTAPFAVAKIMVWGSSSSGDAFAKVIDQSQTDSYEWYRNGDWKIYSIGWTNADLTGPIYCSRVERKFEGPKETNQISLSVAGCNHADFAGTLAGATDLGTTKLELCESVSGISSANSNCTDNLDDAFRVQARGHAMSYRITLRSFLKKGKKTTYGSDVVMSVCKDATPSTGIPDSGLAQGTLSNLPIGDGSTTPFAMQIEAFPGSSSCDSSSHGSYTLDLANGYRAQSSKTFYGVDAGSAHKLYLKMSTDEICRGSALTQTFAGGLDASALTVGQKDLSNASPRLICTESQFYNILLSQYQSFKLLKDIDLRSYYKGENTISYLNSITPLLPGSNFFPLGMDPVSLTRLSTGTEPRSEFPYNFDGGGKTITGMQMHFDNSFTPGCVSFTCIRTGNYRRLRMVDWSLKGFERVSPLGAAHGSVQHVEVVRPVVRGDSYLSALAYASKLSGNFQVIRISEAKVKGSGTFLGFCGGLLGLGDRSGGSARTVIMDNISIDGVIDCAGPSVGGIIGEEAFQIGVSITLAKSKFEGVVKGDSYVGGLVGKYANLLLSSTYAHGWVESTLAGTSIRLGGLVGGAGGFVGVSSLAIDNSYFFGTGRHQCTAGDSSCLLGNMAGEVNTGALPSVTNSYHGNPTSILTPVDIGTSTVQANFYGSVNPLGSFVVSADDLPRLDYETGSVSLPFGTFKSPCAGTQSVASQVVAGKGVSADSPIDICNGKQFALMTNYPDKHFKIRAPLYAHGLNGNATSELTGTIDGMNQPVVGLTLQQNPVTLPIYEETAGSYKVITWWKSLRNRVSNLYLHSPTIPHVANTDASALLALENYSKISNVRVEGLYSNLRTVNLSPSVRGQGVIVGYNYGGISDTHVSGKLDASVQTTGFVYSNYLNGLIKDSSTDVLLKCESSGAYDCNLLAGFAISQKGTLLRTYSGAVIEGNNFVRPDTTSGFSVLLRSNLGTIEDVQVAGSSKAVYYGNGGIMNYNQGILRRAYSESDVTTLNSAIPPVLPATPINSDWAKLSNGGVEYISPTSTNEEVLYRYPGRYYIQGSPYNVTAFNAGTCATNTSKFGYQWDEDINPTYYFAAKDFGASFERYPITVTSLPGGQLKIGTSSCSATNPGTVVVGYETPSAPWQIQATAPFSYSTFTGFDNQTNSLGESVWVADLGNAGIAARVAQIRIALRKGTTLPETAPTWVFDTTNGIRLWHRYLKE